MNENEFLIELQAKLDEEKSKGKIQKTLNALKLQAEIDSDTINKLTKQLEGIINQKIVISNIEINTEQAVKESQQAGQKVGKIVSDEVNQSLRKITSKEIGLSFTVEKTNSDEFNRAVDNEIKRLQQAKNQLQSVKYTTNTFEEDGQFVEKLTGAIFKYNTAAGEAITKTMKWAQIGTELKDGKEVPIEGWVQGLTTYSKSLDEASVKTDSFAEKQKKSITNLTNQLNKIYKGAVDQGSSKPIKDTEHLSALQHRYNEISSAIDRMGEASRTSFVDEENSVKTLISNLQILIEEYKNAETVATSLRSKDIPTVKSQYSSKLDNLITKMKSSGLYTDGFQKGTGNLYDILNNATDSSGLVSFLNGLDKLEAGYKRAKVSAEAFNQSQKVEIKTSGLQSKIDDLQRISPEIQKFKTEINGAEVSIQSLCDDLSKVSTKGDLSVVNEKWRAFRDAAKSAGIAVSDVFQQSNLKSQAKQLYSEISKTAKELNSLQVKQTKLDPNTDFNQWQKLSEQIDNVIIKYDKLQNEFWSNPDYSSYFTIGDFTDLDSKFQKAIDSINTYKAKMQDALTVQSSEIEFSIDNGHGVSQYQNRINGLIKDFQKYGVSVESAKTQTESLQKIFNDMKGLSGQELINQAGKFEQEFKAVKVSIEEAKLSYNELLQPITSTQQVNLTNKIEKWLMNNMRATKSARSELKLYLKELESGDVTKGRYIDIENTFTNIDTHMRSLGKIGKSFFQTMTDGAKKFSYWFSSTMIIMKTINAIRQAIGTVKELDTSLVDLKKTAQMSSIELNNFYLSANDPAKQMGVTTKQIIDQAAAWSRLN